MIRYRLVCAAGHEFDGWFRNSAAFDALSAQHQVTCASCGSSDVAKAVMAPNVALGPRNDREAAPEPARDDPTARILDLARRLRAEVEANAEYVGPKFAQEARRIHYEESEARRIYGEASRRDAAELLDEGISVFQLPTLPEDRN